MIGQLPTPQQARVALEEARLQSAAVRRTDDQFARILLGLAAMYLLVALIMAAFPDGESILGGLAILSIAVGLATIGALFWRIRAYSRGGQRKFGIAAAAFTWWNAGVVAASSWSGWWGPHQPATHFSASAVVAVVPLIVAAWLIGRR